MDKHPNIKCVLLVDDDDSCLQMMAKVFKQKGIETHLAHNGVEAKNEISHEHFDAVIIDVMMPKMNGYELCEFIDHEMPVVLVSGLERDTIADNYLDLTDAFITKSQIKKHLIDATLKAVDRWGWATMKGPIAA